MHQLFHQLRLAMHGALRDPVLQSNLGHFDHLLDVRHQRVIDLENFHQLSHQEHRHGRKGVYDLLHSVSPYPLLRTRHGNEPVWLGATELRHAVFVVEVTVPRAGLLVVGSSGTSPCSASRPHLPALAILCPCGCVDSAKAWRCRKNCLSHRSHRLRAAPAARSPFACDRMNLFPKATQGRQHCEGKRLVLLLWLLFWFVVVGCCWLWSVVVYRCDLLLFVVVCCCVSLLVLCCCFRRGHSEVMCVNNC